MTEHEPRDGNQSAAGTTRTSELPVAAAPPRDPRQTASTAPLGDSVSSQAQSESFTPVMNDIWTGLKRLPSYGRLATAMAKDPRVPRQAKAALFVGGGYLISPIDLIPGIIPVAGQLDDLYVVLTALRQAIRSTPEEIAQEHLRAAGVQLSDLDHDLGAIRRLVKLAAVKTARFGWKLTRETSQQLLHIATQARDRARKGPDHEPL